MSAQHFYFVNHFILYFHYMMHRAHHLLQFEVAALLWESKAAKGAKRPGAL